MKRDREKFVNMFDCTKPEVFIDDEIRDELWNMFTEDQKNYIKKLVNKLDSNSDEECYGIAYLFGNKNIGW